MPRCIGGQEGSRARRSAGVVQPLVEQVDPDRPGMVRRAGVAIRGEGGATPTADVEQAAVAPVAGDARDRARRRSADRARRRSHGCRGCRPTRGAIDHRRRRSGCRRRAPDRSRRGRAGVGVGGRPTRLTTARNLPAAVRAMESTGATSTSAPSPSRSIMRETITADRRRSGRHHHPDGEAAWSCAARPGPRHRRGSVEDPVEPDPAAVGTDEHVLDPADDLGQHRQGPTASARLVRPRRQVADAVADERLQRAQEPGGHDLAHLTRAGGGAVGSHDLEDADVGADVQRAVLALGGHDDVLDGAVLLVRHGRRRLLDGVAMSSSSFSRGHHGASSSGARALVEQVPARRENRRRTRCPTPMPWRSNASA